MARIADATMTNGHKNRQALIQVIERYNPPQVSNYQRSKQDGWEATHIGKSEHLDTRHCAYSHANTSIDEPEERCGHHARTVSLWNRTPLQRTRTDHSG